ncbi:unnamed protein product [Linum trigynum]
MQEEQELLDLLEEEERSENFFRRQSSSNRQSRFPPQSSRTQRYPPAVYNPWNWRDRILNHGLEARIARKNSHRTTGHLSSHLHPSPQSYSYPRELEQQRDWYDHYYPTAKAHEGNPIMAATYSQQWEDASERQHLSWDYYRPSSVGVENGPTIEVCPEALAGPVTMEPAKRFRKGRISRQNP